MPNIFNADNGVVSGSAGIKLSSDTSGVLNIQTNGTTAISISASQVVSFPATSGFSFAGQVTFAAGTAAAPSISVTGDTNTGIYFPAADTIAFTEGGVESMRIDASGNLGLGVTPSAWSGFRALQVGGATSIWSSTSGGGSSFYSNNVYYNGSNRIRINAGFATEYIQDSSAGQHLWFTAGSSTAGSTITFTQAMTLDASGNLALGSASILGSTNRASFTNTVSAKSVLALQNTSTSGYSAIELYDNGGTQQGAMGWGNASVAVTGAQSATYLYSTGPITFLAGGTTERARITSGGDFGIGTTSPQTYTNYTVLTVDNATNGGVVSVRRNGTALLNLYTASGEGRVEAANSAFLSFYTSSAERARIDAAGNMGLGVTPSTWSQGRAFEVLQQGYGVWNGTGSTYLLANTYFNSGFKYANTGAAASHYYQFQGAHVWSTAPSGTAGNAISFTTAMTLDASGNLSLGVIGSGTPTASPTYITLGSLFANTAGDASKAKLRLWDNNAGIVYGFGISNNLFESHVPTSASFAWYINNSERMRINSSGYITTPNQPMISAIHTVTEAPAAGAAIVQWTITVNTVPGNWNAGTGVYTIPVAGKYLISCSLLHNTGGVAAGGIYLKRNSANVTRLFYCDGADYEMGSGTIILDCAINDTISFTNENAASWYGDGGGLGSFVIYLIG